MEERHMRELLEILRGIWEELEDIHKDLLTLNQIMSPKSKTPVSGKLILGVAVSQ
jgi:hypothetical protein